MENRKLIFEIGSFIDFDFYTILSSTNVSYWSIPAVSTAFKALTASELQIFLVSTATAIEWTVYSINGFPSSSNAASKLLTSLKKGSLLSLGLVIMFIWIMHMFTAFFRESSLVAGAHRGRACQPESSWPFCPHLVHTAFLLHAFLPWPNLWHL
jgi:hypothetical protein